MGLHLTKINSDKVIETIEKKDFHPKIIKGRFLLFLSLKSAPNMLSGSEILLKSLFDKLLSPTTLIG